MKKLKLKKTKAKSKNLALSNIAKQKSVIFILVFAIFGGLAIKFSLAAPRTASNNAIVLTNGRSSGPQQPVEQESPNFFDCGGSAGPIYCAFDRSTWVNNPTACDWDVDDAANVYGTGVLAANTTVSKSLCIIADGYDNFSDDNHYVSVEVNAPISTLVVKAFNDHGATYQVTPVPSGSGYIYRLCTQDNTSGPYPIYPNSNNGTGVLVNWYLSVSNPTAKSVRNVIALMQTGFSGSGYYNTGCPAR